MSKDDVTPEAAEVKEEAKDETPQEETIASAIKEDKSENKIPESIPYNRFKEKVDENKELADRVAELESMVSSRDSDDADVSEEVSDIASEYNIDPKVLEKIVDKVSARTQQTIDEKLAPLTQKERQEKQDKVLSQMLDKALEAHPEFQDVVDPDTIKQLALNPANSQKTMSQLIQGVYGKMVQSPDRKTMETTSPGKTEAIDKVDYDRAQTDSEYFSKIKADPKLKAEYNEKMREQISRYM